MILLKPGNRILEQTVKSKVEDYAVVAADEKKKKSNVCDIRLCDFDDVSYRVEVRADNQNEIRVSMALPCFGEIEKFATEELKNVYGDQFQSEPDSDFNVTLIVNAEGQEEKSADVASQIALLKTNTVGGVFKKYLNHLRTDSLSGLDHFKFDLRSDTTIYFAPSADRIIIVFGLDFPDRVDLAVAKVFLQEFQDSKKNRALGSAPPVTFNQNPPSELEKFGVTDASNELGFVSFAILPSHVSTEEKVANVSATLQMFRNYLQYHIKCAKSHFHARMRARVRSLLKVLNRAKTDDKNDAVKKTMSGKTFNRK